MPVVWLGSENTWIWIWVGSLETKAWAVTTLVEKEVKETKCICRHFCFCGGSISVGPEANCLLQLIDCIINNKSTELQGTG